MQKIISIVTATLLGTALHAVTFEKAYGGPDEDLAKSVIVTDDGFTVIGQTHAHRERRADMYIIHMDKKGNKLWSKAIGGRDDEEGDAILATKDGYMAVGTTESFGSDRSSIYTVKLDKEGDAQWQKAYFSSDDSYYYGTGIAKTSDGFKVVGWENKLEFFDAEVFGYVVDIDTEGERRRTRRYGSEDDDMLYDVIKTEGGYVMVGASESFRDDYGFDAWAVKIDEKGKVLWNRIYGWGYDESAYAIAPAKDGGFMLAGITKSNRDKRDEVYVVRIDKNGKMLWQNTYGGRYDDEAFDIVADKEGYVITGLTESNSHGREDLYLLKIDDKGRVVWDRNYGGRDSDVGYGLAATDDGYIVVGETESYGNGRKDAYILKVNKKGLLK
jgi:hypothetical protein